MSENLALKQLAAKLEKRKSEELEVIKQIETESIEELAKSLKASLQKELSTMEEDINKKTEAMVKTREKMLREDKEAWESHFLLIEKERVKELVGLEILIKEKQESRKETKKKLTMFLFFFTLIVSILTIFYLMLKPPTQDTQLRKDLKNIKVRTVKSGQWIRKEDLMKTLERK